MKVHPNLKELLVDFIQWFNDENKLDKNTSYNDDVELFLSTNSLSECERQPVGNNEQGGNNFNCLGVIKGLSDNECSSYCGNEYCNGY